MTVGMWAAGECDVRNDVIREYQTAGMCGAGGGCERERHNANVLSFISISLVH